MKIATTVGTSLITNKLEDVEIRNLYDILKYKNYDEKEKYNKKYYQLYQKLLQEVRLDVKESAEFKSLLRLKDKFKDEYCEIELLATDTILSPICADVIKEMFGSEKNIEVKFSDKNIIKDLQVNDYVRYKKGLINLLNRLNSFLEEVGSINLIINITGGFKGIIPYLTIFGQINAVKIFYIFEFTDSLIEIPQIPITLQRDIFDKYWQTFYRLEKENILTKKDFEFNLLKDYESIFEIEDDMISFNPLGKILWDKYRKENFIFYSTNEIYKEINSLSQIKRILVEKFTKNYSTKTEMKGGHNVYDDGKNSNRIFYFVEETDIYIYKAFENHDKYEKYINEKNIDKENYKKSCKIRKL